MQWLKDRFFSSNIKPEMIRRGMQVHRTNGHNYVIRFYHQPDLDEEEMAAPIIGIQPLLEESELSTHILVTENNMSIQLNIEGSTTQSNFR